MDDDHDLPPLPLPPMPESSTAGQHVLLPDKEPSRPPSAGRKVHRSSSEMFRSSKDRDRAYPSSRDLARLLVYEERETKELHRMVRSLVDQLNVERQRAEEAERRLTEVLSRLKSVNDARNVALRDTAVANENLKMYKVQLDNAQKEIYRAQALLDDLDRQRYRAEEDSAKLRSTVREMREDQLINVAREEGRREGFNEGLARAKAYVINDYSHTRYIRQRDVSSTEDEELYEDTEETNETETSTTTHVPKKSLSRAPSISQMSRMSLPLRTPALTPAMASIPMLSPKAQSRASQSPTPSMKPADSRPTPAQSPTPMVQHPPFIIPPDGWIPQTDKNSFINLPPPHELSRPVNPTSPYMATPQLPNIPEVKPQEEEKPLYIPPPASVRQTPRMSEPQPLAVPTPTYRHPTPKRREYRRTQTSSPESNSTHISDFELLNEPQLATGRRSPLSVITEVLSVNTSSPNPAVAKSPSMSTIQVHPTPQVRVTPGENYHNFYTRPMSSASSSDSSKQWKSTANGRKKKRSGSHSSSNGVPDINIQPPSRPTSDSSGKPPSRQRSLGDLLSPADASRPLADGISSPPASNAAPPTAAMEDVYVQEAVPGSYYGHSPTPELTPAVIPDPRLREASSETTESDEDDISSGMSDDTLTTPPPSSRNEKIGKIASPGHLRSGSGGRYSAAGVPLPPSTIGSGTPKSGYYGSFTPSKSRKSHSISSSRR